VSTRLVFADVRKPSLGDLVAVVFLAEGVATDRAERARFHDTGGFLHPAEQRGDLWFAHAPAGTPLAEGIGDPSRCGT